MMHTFPQKTRELHNHHFNSTIWNDFQFRDDDIAIATYAKSGTTWVQQSSRSSFSQALTASKLLRCRRGWICVFRRRKSNSLDFMSRECSLSSDLRVDPPFSSERVAESSFVGQARNPWQRFLPSSARVQSLLLSRYPSSAPGRALSQSSTRPSLCRRDPLSSASANEVDARRAMAASEYFNIQLLHYCHSPGPSRSTVKIFRSSGITAQTLFISQMKGSRRTAARR